VTRSTAIFVLFSLVLCCPARGVERRVAEWDLRQGPYGADPGRAAVQCLADTGAAAWPAGSRSSLQITGVEERDGMATVRVQQQHGDLPVLGSHAVVRFDPEGHATVVNATLFESLSVEPHATVTPEQAVAAALESVGAPDHAEVSVPGLAVLPDGAGGSLVYDLHIFSEAPLRSLRVQVDATRGEVVRVQDRVVEAWGRAYETSPAHGEPIDVELVGLDGDATVLDGEFAATQSVASANALWSAEHLAVADEQGDFLFDPVEPSHDDPFAEVNAYYHVTRAARYFQEVHGHELDSQIAVYTNYFISEPFDCPNAFYTQDNSGTDLLIYGQWDVDFGYDGDVVLHEFGHLINHARAPLEMDYFYYDDHGWYVGPGAIDEGVADYWSATLQDDSSHAEYSSALLAQDRELDNDRTCPGDVIGESHHDGQVVSGAAWELREALGPEVVDALMYEAMGLLTGQPTFHELAQAISAVAHEKQQLGDLDDDQAATVDSVLEGRGLLDCDRAVPMADGVTTDLHLSLFYWLYGFAWVAECRALQDTDTRFGAYFQLSFTTPSADQGELLGLSFDLVAEADNGGFLTGENLDYTLYLRRGEMVTFEMVQTPDTTLFPYSGSGKMPSALDYDLEIDGSPALVELTPDSDLAVEPDTTYYLAVSHMNCENVRLGVTPRLEIEAAADDDAASDDDEAAPEEGEGCQCKQEGRAGGPGVAWLVLLLTWAAIWSRRGRT